MSKLGQSTATKRRNDGSQLPLVCRASNEQPNCCMLHPQLWLLDPVSVTVTACLRNRCLTWDALNASYFSCSNRALYLAVFIYPSKQEPPGKVNLQHHGKHWISIHLPSVASTMPLCKCSILLFMVGHIFVIVQWTRISSPDWRSYHYLEESFEWHNELVFWNAWLCNWNFDSGWHDCCFKVVNKQLHSQGSRYFKQRSQYVLACDIGMRSKLWVVQNHCQYDNSCCITSALQLSEGGRW